MLRFKTIAVFSIATMCHCSFITAHAKNLHQYSNIKTGKSVTETYADLESRAEKNPSAVKIITSPDGWQVVYENKNDRIVVWSFTPKTEKAHPAFVRREVTVKNGLVMRVVCEAKKQDCDDLVNTFNQMNIEVIESAQ
jgi:hypothetical protein